MKNKESFLKELEGRLSVLEEAEQKDILSEYAQHIDLRVSGGLTEEEAIQDFGEVDELAAEILAAYHVDPAYQPPEGTLVSVPDPRPALRRGAAVVGAFFKRLGSGIAGGLRRAGRGLKTLFCRMGRGLRSLRCRCGEKLKSLRRPGVKPETKGAGQEKETGKVMESVEKKGMAWTGIRRGAGRLFRALGRFCRSAARVVWNLFLLLCSLPFICGGLLALMCLGMLLVLLIQGYPLAGVTLCCLGGAACCVGILGLGSGLVWRRTVGGAQAEASALIAAERGGEGHDAE